MATEKQKKVVNGLVENSRSKKTKNLGEILESADYSKATQIKPSQVIRSKGVQTELKPFIDRLIAHRDKIQEAMEGKDLTKEQYRTLSDAMTKANHDIQLLTGSPTENFSFNIDPEKLKKINEIMDKNE